MTKKFLCTALVLTILLLAFLPAAAEDSGITSDSNTAVRMRPIQQQLALLTQADLDKEAAKFSDVPKHWGKAYVSKLSALSIIAGYPNGKFGPDDKLLGGQFVLILMKTLGYTLEVQAGKPYYQSYVDQAIKDGILQKNEIADYDKPLTREIATSMARKAIGKYETVPADYFVKGTDWEGKGDKGFFDNVYVGYQKLKMTDYTTIQSKYLQDVIDCYRMGIIAGSNNKFNPKGSLTRAEASVIAIKLLDKSTRVESVPGPNESFKFKNPITKAMAMGYSSDEYGKYDNKEYLFYKGYFPLMEIWDTVYAMEKNKNKMVGGATTYGFMENYKNLGMAWFPDAETEYKFRFNPATEAIYSQNNINVFTDKTKLQKGETDNIYDNVGGYLYEVRSSDVDNYNKALKPYVYELMKIWFGSEYEKAKALHDRYLGYALNDDLGKADFYMINGRQVRFAGGHDLGGKRLSMQVWGKDFITEKTMYKD